MTLPDNRFIAATSLEEYFVDKSSGLPLSAGYVYFYQDIARTVPKLVYQLTGDPANVGGYTFAALPNPLRISATGTFQDNDGNNIAVYYFPYDGLPDTSTNVLDLYYIVVQDEAHDLQFDRAAWPPIAEDLATEQSSTVYVNQISNPQFIDVYFDQLNSAIYTFATAGTFVYSLAPDWDLVVMSNNAGSVTVTRIPISGSNPVATNPAYALKIVPGLSIVSLNLRQKLDSNPGIWSQINGAQNGYVSGGILLYPNCQATMTYVPNTGMPKTIFNLNNTSATATYFNKTVQLPVSTNPSTPPTGRATIIINVPATGPGTILSSIQVVGLVSNQTVVPYVQDTVNRQKDYLFHYYNDLLQFKPIKSYLTGWDFPLNPAQFGTSGNVNGAANKSQYAWDQTIIYTSASTGVSYSANAATNALRVTATGGDTQIALVQYIDQVTARALLNNDLSVNISAVTSNPAKISGTVSLWYTTSAQLPDLATGASIVDTLTAEGNVNTRNGTWTEVRRTLAGNAPGQFILDAVTAGVNYFNVPLTGWGANNTGANTATYFAIVVGFASLPATRYIEFNSISLVPGRIPTIPAPQTLDDVLRDCQYYYSQSYPQASLVGTETKLGQLITAAFNISGQVTSASFQLQYPAPMRVAPVVNVYPTYNSGGATPAGNISLFYQTPTPITNTPWITNFYKIIPITDFNTANLIGSNSTTTAVYCASVIDYSPGGSGPGIMAYQYVADARLGIVL